MRSNNTPVFKDIVLAGGGHAHSLLIRQWGMHPLPGVRLTLVSSESMTPYSGMLPGLIAGHYSFEDIHIDLVRLCQWANVRFVMSVVTGIDPENKQLFLKGRPALGFEALSINTGSTPDHEFPGVEECVIPVKPIAGFWQRWLTLIGKLEQSEQTHNITVVGGGASSVEAVLAMAWACRKNPGLKELSKFHLVFQNETILPDYPKRVIKAATNACQQLGIQLHSKFKVSEVSHKKLTGEQGRVLETDYVFWCVQASAPDWPTESGLVCNEDGFIEVNEFLQSVSHPCIFAAGDIAHMSKNPRPKAGVYAVRQAPYLIENINHFLLNTDMKAYVPQDGFLSLLALGEKKATGNRGIATFSGQWIWRWKDSIDRKFMRRFKQLPNNSTMDEKQEIPHAYIPEAEKSEKLDPSVRCGGCGAKVGGQVLSEVLTKRNKDWQPEDSSIINWPESALVQTVDLLKAPFDDPWLMGRIAVFHALNDLLAMNAIPHSIQVVLTLPFAGRKIQARELELLMAGIESACGEENVDVIGGHTSEGNDLIVCITANGKLGKVGFTKQGANKGDLLAINKPLGTGIILAGHMGGQTKGHDLVKTLEIMNTSNSAIRPLLEQVGVKSCTDISGFGLLGHLSEMMINSKLSAALFMDKIPLQEGVEELVRTGVTSTLNPQNEVLLKDSDWAQQYHDSPLFPVLLDPQTSGGLLAMVPGSGRSKIEDVGFCIIGEIIDS